MSVAPELLPRTVPRPLRSPRSTPTTHPAGPAGDLDKALPLLWPGLLALVEVDPADEVTRSDLPEVAGSGVALTARAEVRRLVEEAEVRRQDQLPDPRPLAGQLAQAVVEVLSGDRPITQLLTWLNEQIYLELSVLAPDPVTTPTLRGARIVTIRPQDRPKVRSVHVCRPADGVAEFAARVQTNGRSRAVAMRLEEWRGRWRCCALVVG